MMIKFKSCPIRALLLTAVLASSSFGATITLPATVTGTLPDQGSVLLDQFTLLTPTDVTITTTSYMTGGFQPNLFLFDGSGAFLSAGVPFGSPDPGTGVVGDLRLLALNLAPGMYTLALTDFYVNQSLTATSLSDGFTENYGDGTFQDANGNSRTGAYAFSVTANAVPEPGTWLLTSSGLGLLFLRARRARKLTRN